MKKFISIILTFVLCFLLLSPSYAEAATVKLNKTKLSLTEGQTYTLRLTGTSKTVTWSSSDKKVATVSRGKVTAVASGTATVTAKVSGKSFTCKVTVKEAFNAKKAIANINADVTDTGSGLIVILENKYQYDFSLEATVIYYDEGGDMIGKSTNDNYYFTSGTKCALDFIGPYDADYLDVPYTDYKITYSIERTSEYTKSCLGGIKVNSNYGADNVMAEVTNDGDQEPEYTLVSIVYYKNGEAIAYDYTYAEVQSSGSTDYLEFSFPYDENYNTVQPDDYQIFVNYSYYYNY